MEKVDFTIVQHPVAIKLECPYCEADIEISWEDVNAPEYWGDDWGEIECPYCENTIVLGDCEFD